MIGWRPGGQLVEHRDIQVAVERQRERARDRRGGHHQHVRVVALLAQGVALLHAEAVLLVHHRQPQPLKLDALLDQRVRADGHGGLRRSPARRGRRRAPSPSGCPSAGPHAARTARAACSSRDSAARPESRSAPAARPDSRSRRRPAARRRPPPSCRSRHRLAAGGTSAAACARSARISRMARRCAPVKRNGSDASKQIAVSGQSSAAGPSQPSARRSRLICAASGVREDQRLGDGQRGRGWAVAQVGAAREHAKLDQEQFVEGQAAARGRQRALVVGIVHLRDGLGQRSSASRGRGCSPAQRRARSGAQ